MFPPALAILFPEEVVRRMEAAARKLPLESRKAQRAWIYVMAAEGIPIYAAAQTLLINRSTVKRWRDKFLGCEDPEALLAQELGPGRPSFRNEEFKDELTRVRQENPALSTRKLGKLFGVSHMTIQRILKEDSL